MKGKLFLAVVILITAGLMFAGCDEAGKDTPVVYLTPNSAAQGINQVTEAAVLAATGLGVTGVEKTSKGYEVTGTVAAFSNWDGSETDNRIQLNIKADPENPDAYFALANRYVITINFPNSTVKPYDTYTDGFQIYLDNNKATDNTSLWGGTWQREWPDEYNAIGGVGRMTINRDLKIDPKVDGSASNVGDYQNYTMIVKFDDADLGKEYKFTISNVGVFADGVSALFPRYR